MAANTGNLTNTQQAPIVTVGLAADGVTQVPLVSAVTLTVDNTALATINVSNPTAPILVPVAGATGTVNVSGTYANADSSTATGTLAVTITAGVVDVASLSITLGTPTMQAAPAVHKVG